jgi:hypothetical protein
MLKRIFGPRAQENGDSCIIGSSTLDHIRVVKSRTMRWAGHAAGMEH